MRRTLRRTDAVRPVVITGGHREAVIVTFISPIRVVELLLTRISGSTTGSYSSGTSSRTYSAGTRSSMGTTSHYSTGNSSGSRKYNTLNNDPEDYDDPEEYADDAWGDDFEDWDEAYDYWEDY